MALWGCLTEAFEFDVREMAMLEVAARQADDVAALEAVIERDGYTAVGSAGQQRLNQAVTEVRQGRIALGRLLGFLAIGRAQSGTDWSRLRSLESTPVDAMAAFSALGVVAEGAPEDVGVAECGWALVVGTGPQYVGVGAR